MDHFLTIPQESQILTQTRIVDDVSEFFNVSEDPSLTDIEFTEEDIIAACSELKSSSAAGADGVPASFLKTCRKELTRPLFILWIRA